MNWPPKGWLCHRAQHAERSHDSFFLFIFRFLCHSSSHSFHEKINDDWPSVEDSQLAQRISMKIYILEFSSSFPASVNLCFLYFLLPPAVLKFKFPFTGSWYALDMRIGEKREFSEFIRFSQKRHFSPGGL
ncbi:hypothetical protein TNIN_97321 [Trichonephila inaurata madagascariensis]|uniref:Uncharacterized protein n=1 Tax=Trichonephila inaurata madagascariensis TaxID=2747483 RepID=A0A8X6XDI1_9ARAC|nr:hypothetical protein TNIN_97321 [Trichonephila inaurata madagascariensis]